MKRHWVFALAVLAALPRLAHAQADTGWGPVFRITPFVGISPGINQKGEATAFSNNNVTGHAYRVEYSSSIPIGIAVEARAWNQFTVVAEGVWAHRGDGRLIDFEDEVVYNTAGTNFWMGKIGLGMRLREGRSDMQLRRLNASIFIAPALVHDDPVDNITTPAASNDNINQFALNLGADAELPLSDTRLAFNIALEDWIIYWDETKYAARVGGYFQQLNSTIDAVALDADKTHFWVLRAGLSYRF